MSISSELTKLNTNMQNAYTAVNNKGGTLPASQNMDNLATAIGSIPSGSSGYTELPSYQVVNGVASRRSGALTGNEFSNITSVGTYGLYMAFERCEELTGFVDLSSLTSVGERGFYNAFAYCYGLTSVDLSSLTSVSTYGFYGAFYICSGLTSIDLSSLTSVGSSGLYSAFSSCTKLTSVNFPSLTSIDGSGLSNVFSSCTELKSVSFPALTSIGGSGLYYAFSYCSKITDVYFNSLTTTSFGSYTDQFQNMLSSTGRTVTHTLHFPSNLQSTIQGLTGYPTFSGTSGYVVCAFDLPATS
mgnify:CR=1 FL=1